ncbi:MAG: hypothetical protein ABSD08_18045 [Xanthobacteraceae bacterium]|jgi:hypothetical protein
MLRDAELSKAAHVSIEFSEEEQLASITKEFGQDPIGYLEKHGYHTEVKRICINQLSLALFADMMHFVHEALKALEKRKTTVALALLRKPLKENLFFAAWMCADEDEFFHKFAKSPPDEMESERLSASKRRQVLADAIKKLDPKTFSDADVIYDLIYEKKTDRGLANLFDKATHLVTSRGVHLRTEKMNLNFIFKSPLDTDVYDYVYFRIAYLLIFALLIQTALYSRMGSLNPSYKMWVCLVALGTYHALFVDGPSPIIESLNRSLKEFLVCPYCRSRARIRKSYAAQFFIGQKLLCASCRNDSDFPLFWLLSKMNWKLSESA